MTDMINPNHYRGDRVRADRCDRGLGLNYRLGNAVKYISRNGRKPGEDREGLKRLSGGLRQIEALDGQKPTALSTKTCWSTRQSSIWMKRGPKASSPTTLPGSGCVRPDSSRLSDACGTSRPR